MLKFNSVNISVDNRQLLTVDDLIINNGIVALIGRNGAGKSTLLRSIIGQHKEVKGSIVIKGKELSSFSSIELAKEVAIVYTKPQLFGRHTTREVLLLGRLPYQNFMAKITADDIAVVDEVVEMLELKSFENQLFNSLSDGEKQLVMIGRALAQETSILLLDEPTAFLDIVNKQKLLDFVKKVAKTTEKLILFSTHQIDVLEKYCDSILLIDDKKIKHISNKENFVLSIKSAFKINSNQE